MNEAVRPRTILSGAPFFPTRDRRLPLQEEIGRDSCEHEQGIKQSLLRLGELAAPNLVGAPLALFQEMLFPILHAEFVEN